MRLTKKALRLLTTRIRERMEAEHLSHTEMAARLGVSERALRYWMAEESSPGPNTQRRVEQALAQRVPGVG